MTRNTLLLIIMFAALLLAAWLMGHQPPVNEWKGINGSVPTQYYPEDRYGEITDLANFKPPEKMDKTEQSFGNYYVCTYRDYNNEGYFEIYKNKHLIYACKGPAAFYINNFTYDFETQSEIPALKMGTDITGDGQPNLVIGEWTGGAHAYFNSYVFEIGKEFRKIAVIEGAHTQPVFKDVNNDNRLEAVLRDWTWAYWPSGFASSPAPKIILRYEKDKYILAPDLMRRPPKTKEEFNQVKTQVKQELETDMKEQSGNFSLALIVNPMFDLIYSGNAKQAWQLFNEVWAEKEPDRSETIKLIQKALAASPYWPEIEAMNQNTKKQK